MRIVATAASFLLAACAGAPPPRTPHVDPSCQRVRGKMPGRVAGSAELRGVLEVSADLVGRTVFFGLDYSTKGTRRSVAVGALEVKDDQTRFRCIAPAPADASFWQWIVVADPQDECGYFTETSTKFETTVRLRCDPAARQSWTRYGRIFSPPGSGGGDSSGAEQTPPEE